MRFNLVCLSALISAHTAWCGTVTLDTQLQACVNTNTQVNDCSTQATGTITDGADNITFNNFAGATFGILHGSTQSTFTVTNGKALSLAISGFTDLLTINSATMQGQAGTLNASYLLDGQISSNGNANAFLQVVANMQSATTQLYVADFNQNPLVPITTYNQTVNMPSFTFIYGQQFTLVFQMEALAGLVSDPGNQGFSFDTGTGSGTAYANFADTLILNGLHTDDPNATITSQSGTVYTQAGVAPEPATLLLCAVPLAIFGFVKLRR